ncbi:hypothetical protein ACFLXL_03450, partial [Chloroflexota bacterium]
SPKNQDSNASNNQQPVAYIDAILPTTASAGEKVSFRGHGTDTDDGIIIAYEWRSSMDGVLSTAPSFTTSSLSSGMHTIIFKVLDNNNSWSEEISSTVEITAKITKPIINSFTANPPNIVAGNTVQLSWNISGAKTVFIDNGIGNVDVTDSKMLYPSATTAYTLTATNEAGSVNAVATVEVLISGAVGNPVIHYFTAQYLGGTSWQLQWNVSDATNVVIEPNIGSVGLSGSIQVSTPITQSYKLTATNGWGWAYHTVTVGYQ